MSKSMAVPHRRRIHLGVWLFALLCFGAWLTAVYGQRPAAAFHRAQQALDADRVESLQYAIVRLRNRTEYEAHTSLLTGKLLVAEGRFDAALEALGVAKDNPGTRARALALGGEALYKIGRFLDAGVAWTEALDIDPENADALRWLGVAYSDLGATVEARRYLQRAAAALPTDTGALKLLGLLAKETGNFDEALDAFRESLRRNPVQPDAELLRFEIAECLHQLNENEEALALLKSCQPTAETLTLMAYVANRLGRSEEAWNYCTEAVQLNPKLIKPMLLEAQIAVERRQDQEALELLQQVVALQPGYVQAHYQLASVWRRLGNDREAAEAGRRATELSKLEERYQTLRDKIAHDPRDASLRLELGNLALRMNTPVDAGRWFRAALYLDPDNQEAETSLRKLLFGEPPGS